MHLQSRCTLTQDHQLPSLRSFGYAPTVSISHTYQSSPSYLRSRTNEKDCRQQSLPWNVIGYIFVEKENCPYGFVIYFRIFVGFFSLLPQFQVSIRFAIQPLVSKESHSVHSIHTPVRPVPDLSRVSDPHFRRGVG